MRRSRKADEDSIAPGTDASVAIPALLTKYGPRLHAVSLRMCGHRADAQDLVQEVFLQAFRQWRTFRGDSDPGTWLYTIAARSCKARLRRKGGIDRRMPAISQLMPWSESTVLEIAANPEEENAAERNESVANIRRAISQLPEFLRVPLVMKEVLGVSVLDVAAALSLTENTVKTRLFRARLQLRKTMRAKGTVVDAPEPMFDRQVCIDLLKAKMDALDRGREGAGFRIPKAEMCARCSAVFREFDLVHDACAEIAEGKLPESLRAAVLKAISARGEVNRKVRRGRRPARQSAAS